MVFSKEIPKWASWAISCVCFGQIQKYVVISCISLVWADGQAKRSSADGLLLNHPDFTKRRRWLQTTALLNLSRVSGNVVYCQQNGGGLNPPVCPANSCFWRTRPFQSSVVEGLKWNVTRGSCLCGGGDDCEVHYQPRKVPLTCPKVSEWRHHNIYMLFWCRGRGKKWAKKPFMSMLNCKRTLFYHWNTVVQLTSLNAK